MAMKCSITVLRTFILILKDFLHRFMYVNLIGRLRGLLWKNVLHLREGQSSVITSVTDLTVLDVFSLLPGHLSIVLSYVGMIGPLKNLKIFRELLCL